MPRISAFRSGSLVYVPSGVELGSRMLFWVDRQGMAQPVEETARRFWPHPRLSPDGRRLAISIRDVKNVDHLWLHELDRRTWARLTFEGDNEKPIWTPDGKRIIFMSSRADALAQVFSMSADGSGQAEQLTKGAYRVPTSLSPDGISLVFRQRGDDGSWDIGTVSLEGERHPEILLATPFDEHNGMISPDNRRLAYVSNESGADEVYVTSFPKTGGKWPISTEGGTEPMWSPDGKELFYRNGEKMMVVAISTEPDFTPGKPTLSFEGEYSASTDVGAPSSNYDVTADGQRFVMVGRPAQSARTRLNVVLNWFDELKRLAPVNSGN